MNRPARLTIAAMFGALLLCAQSGWIHVQSRNFQAFSQVDQRQTEALLGQFERIREFFLQLSGGEIGTPLPVYVVMFRSPREYAPYRPKEFATAHYAPMPDRDYIVLGDSGEQAAQSAAHEYAHLAIRHAGTRYPPWLNEGLAEMYSNIRVVGNEVEYATPIPGRIRALKAEPWVPLATIVNAGQDSPYYDETKKAGSLYNESWALVQFLSTSAVYSSRFEQVLQAIKAGTPSVAAIESVYGRSLARIEQDLKDYIAGGTYLTKFLTMSLDSAQVGVKPASASTLDLQLILASLKKSGDDSRNALLDLTRANPNEAKAWVQAAYSAMTARDTKSALDYFAKAYALGDHSPQLLFDYGRLAEVDKPLDAVKLLAELLKVEPDNLDARIELGYAQARVGQAREALATVGTIRQIDAERGQMLFYAMASAQLQLGQFAEARASADRLQSAALTPVFRDAAAQLLRQIDARMGQRPAAPKAAAAKPAAAPPRTLYEIRGPIVRVECEEVPIIVVQASQGRYRLLLEPQRYSVSGKQPEGGLQCGPLNLPVRVRYEGSQPEVRADGAVRELEFQ